MSKDMNDLDVSDITKLSDEELAWASDNRKISDAQFDEEVQRRGNFQDPRPEGFIGAPHRAEPQNVPGSDTASRQTSSQEEEGEEPAPWNKSMTKGELREALVARGYEVVPEDSDEFKAVHKDELIATLEQDDKDRES